MSDDKDETFLEWQMMCDIEKILDDISKSANLTPVFDSVTHTEKYNEPEIVFVTSAEFDEMISNSANPNLSDDAIKMIEMLFGKMTKQHIRPKLKIVHSNNDITKTKSFATLHIVE